MLVVDQISFMYILSITMTTLFLNSCVHTIVRDSIYEILRLPGMTKLLIPPSTFHPHQRKNLERTLQSGCSP